MTLSQSRLGKTVDQYFDLNMIVSSVLAIGVFLLTVSVFA